jgi:hypothetical protein
MMIGSNVGNREQSVGATHDSRLTINDSLIKYATSS